MTKLAIMRLCAGNIQEYQEYSRSTEFSLGERGGKGTFQRKDPSIESQRIHLTVDQLWEWQSQFFPQFITAKFSSFFICHTKPVFKLARITIQAPCNTCYLPLLCCWLPVTWCFSLSEHLQISPAWLESCVFSVMLPNSTRQNVLLLPWGFWDTL